MLDRSLAAHLGKVLRRQTAPQPPRVALLALLLTSVFCWSACGEMPMSGRYEGAFSQTVQVRETTFGSQGGSAVTERELSNTQDRPLLIAVGVDSDAVLEGLACPSVPLFFRDAALILERGHTCEIEVDVETRNGADVVREVRTETIDIEDLEVTEIEPNLIDVRGAIRREFTTVVNGLRALTHEEDIAFSFDGVRVAPAVGAL